MVTADQAEQAFQDWARTYHGSDDPRSAYRVHKSIEDQSKRKEARAALGEQKAPEYYRYVKAILSDAVESIVQLRSKVGDMSSDDAKEFVDRLLTKIPAEALPAASRDDVKLFLTNAIADFHESQNATDIRGTSLSNAALSIADRLPTSFEPRTAADTAAETAATVAAIPRA